MKYRVKKQFAAQEEMVTTVNNKTVALIKDLHIKIPDSQSGPGKTKVIKLATQEEMAIMFKDGNPVIEQYDDQVTK